MANLELIIKILANKKFKSQLEFEHFLRLKTNKLKITPPAKRDLLKIYQKLLKSNQIKKNSNLEKFLTKAKIRTSSGVSVITVLTKPYPCSGNCLYCPTEPQMPKSYLANEPAAQRAARLKFDPIKMVQKRIQALEINGHQVDKIELLILGGSFTAYIRNYRQSFVTKCFYAANTYNQKTKRIIKSLNREQKINETARYKIIGVTLETRPDEINKSIIKEFRQLGCTRVQLGIQHLNDKILKNIHRGHTTADSIQATRLLKENGFKVDHHYMPDLPGSTPAQDLQMMQTVFTSPDWQPDQIKLYPCVVTKNSALYLWFKNKKYQPYSKIQLLNLLLKIKIIVPPWVRINRLIRDIPKESIIAGNKITNLRQYLQAELKKKNKVCHCIRCREIGTNSLKLKTKNLKLFIEKYPASRGEEYFISYENPDRRTLYGFVRLRFNGPQSQPIFSVLKNSALIRELHVYGQMLPAGTKVSGVAQHHGLGKKLMTEAEKLAQYHGYSKIAVIAGVGVRNYYRRLGYRLQETYMVKNLKN